MIQIGKEAIDDEARDWGRHHGRSNGRSFQAFWLDRYELDAANNKFEARLVDHLALAQVMAVLPRGCRRRSSPSRSQATYPAPLHSSASITTP
jgi:hypothetical protein